MPLNTLLHIKTFIFMQHEMNQLAASFFLQSKMTPHDHESNITCVCSAMFTYTNFSFSQKTHRYKHALPLQQDAGALGGAH